METKKNPASLGSQGFGVGADRRLLLIEQRRAGNKETLHSQGGYGSGAEIDRQLLLITLKKTRKPSKFT